jgi:hypothetical protein
MFASPELNFGIANWIAAQLLPILLLFVRSITFWRKAIFELFENLKHGQR